LIGLVSFGGDCQVVGESLEVRDFKSAIARGGVLENQVALVRIEAHRGVGDVVAVIARADSALDVRQLGHIAEAALPVRWCST
jgi:hypothetical protein